MAEAPDTRVLRSQVTFHLGLSAVLARRSQLGCISCAACVLIGFGKHHVEGGLFIAEGRERERMDDEKERGRRVEKRERMERSQKRYVLD